MIKATCPRLPALISALLLSSCQAMSDAPTPSGTASSSTSASHSSSGGASQSSSPAPADAGGLQVLSDEALLAYANSSYDKREMMFKTLTLGLHHGLKVVARFPCSDVCPQYTTRLIYYEVPMEKCQELGGVERELLVPRGIAVVRQSFCLPPVLATAQK